MKRKGKTVQAAFCGLVTALSVALMFSGSLLSILTYTMPAVAGAVLILITASLGRGASFIVYFCTSVIAALLVPDKECVVMYFAFFGYYPIIKLLMDNISPGILRYAAKFLLYNVSIVLSQVFVVKVLGIPLDESGGLGKWVIPVLLVMANILFVLYDVALGQIWRLYDIKYRKYFDKFIK